MVAVKDCLWVKSPKGWEIENCPLGEGLVDWTFVGKALRDAAFAGPISLHLGDRDSVRHAEHARRREARPCVRAAVPEAPRRSAKAFRREYAETTWTLKLGWGFYINTGDSSDLSDFSGCENRRPYRRCPQR